jgi:hypothetical protein
MAVHKHVVGQRGEAFLFITRAEGECEMGMYNVHIFITQCYIPSVIQVDRNIFIEPFEGVGVSNVADLIDSYLSNKLGQPLQPAAGKLPMLNKIKDDGASVVLTVTGLQASTHRDAILLTEEAVLMCRDILALRQLHRGYLAGFLSVQTDVSPVALFSFIRRPYSILRKIQNVPIGESESDIFGRLYEKAQKHPLLGVYLSLYGDTVAYSDTLVTDISLETRLLKTWSLLETMALSEPPRHKKSKVKSLFNRCQIGTHPDYNGHKGQDLLDVAYKWRNIIAHSGGCQAASSPNDQQFCQNFQPEFEKILEDLSQRCRDLLHAYANSLP